MNDRLVDLVMRLLGSQGRDGDTMLAHINPREAEMLKEAGGRGTINPRTGLPEFSDSGYSGSGGGSSAATGGSSASDTMSGFSFDDPGKANTSPGVPAGKVDMLDKIGSMGLTSLAGLLSGTGPAIGLANTASSLAGGPNIAQMIADYRAGTRPTETSALVGNPLGGFDQLAVSSPTPQTGAGLSQGAGPATGASVNGTNVGPGPQGGGAGGLDAFLSAYLQPQAAAPATPQQPTPEQQALAARGFYSTPTPSTSAPVGAIDPALLSAMLYARG